MTLTTTTVVILVALCFAAVLAVWRVVAKAKKGDENSAEAWQRWTAEFKQRQQEEMGRRTVPWGADTVADD